MENNTSKVKLGDGVVDVTKGVINDRTKNLSQNLVNMFFDYLEQNIVAVSDTLRPNLIRHTYEEKAEFTDLLKNEKYRWIEQAE